MTRAALLAGIRADASALLEVLHGLDDADFARPTPCAAWDVAHVTAHLYRDFERVGQALAAVTDDPPDRDRVTYWHYDRAENQARTQLLADQHVAQLGTDQALVAALDGMLADAVAEAAAAPESGAAGALVVRLTWGPVLVFEEFLATRWLELVVHSLDITDGLGLPARVSADGVAMVADVLDRLAARASGAAEPAGPPGSGAPDRQPGRALSAEPARPPGSGAPDRQPGRALSAAPSAPSPDAPDGAPNRPLSAVLGLAPLDYIRAATGRTDLSPAAAARLPAGIAAAWPLLA